MSNELWRKGALELAGMIARKEVSSRDVVAAHLARIDEVNPWLNAVVRRWDDASLAAADAADKAVAAGDSLGALHGVPVTVKENIDLAGTPTTQAVAFLAEAVSTSDAPLVQRARAAGAIPIGRTNLPDLGLRITTESSLHGVTHNPWHPGRTAGGSSGGEGSALASGMSPLGFGNDIGGSLRNPATCCGITSIKPTTGVVPWATEIPPQDPGIAAQLMLTDGPMARHVADVRAGLLAIAGAHDRDPRAVPVVLADRAQGRALRVAVCAAPPAGSTHAEVAAAIQAAGDAFSNAGAHVTEAVPASFQRAVELWGLILNEELRVQRPLLEMVMGDDGKRFLGFADEVYPPIDVATLMLAFGERNAVDREWHEFLTEYDVLLMPTWTQPPFELGADIVSVEAAQGVLEQLRAALPANLLGLPSAIVPVGMAGGLPVGAQLVGRRFADLTTLAAAEVLEQAFGTITPIDPVRS
ncbi:MAG TPA: amidase [Ilumatobacteraceae bacterium]|jgi:amidase|nr:amidase [Ilumatobacteraceae bacterium]HQY84790.1 amidase [Ilumatobacteraceae bacterium]HRA82726.1 amidase [Ilumatobacteraceae bacterium]HRC46242.1 amidase [Ilumatobacteraceae bacterium]